MIGRSKGAQLTDDTLRTALADAYPAGQPTTETWRRVDLGIDERQRRAERGSAAAALLRRRPVRLAFAFAGAAGVVALFAAIGPTLAAAQVLGQVDAALPGVRAVHIVEWTKSHTGRMRKASEMWYGAGGSRRVEETLTGHVRLFTGGKLWIYEPDLRKATFRTLKGDGLVLNQFTLKGLLGEATRRGVLDSLRRLDDGQVGGRSVHRIRIEPGFLSGESVRMTLAVDAATDLPVQAEMEVPAGTGWAVERRFDFQYPARLAEALFAPEFGAGVRIVDADNMQADWGRRLAPGFARKHVGDRDLVLRDLQANSAGNVFLLYTAGKLPEDQFRCGNWLAGRDWEVSLEDDLGTEYIRTGLAFQPVMKPPLQRGRLNGFVFDGARLEGDLWVPLEPQEPWQPREFTITFRVNPVNLHGSAADPEMTAVYSQVWRYSMKVERPATAGAPDYMPFMALPISDGVLADLNDSQRAEYYQRHGRDLERSLALYRKKAEATQERMRRTGQRILMPQTWLHMYEVLTTLGRREEARAALLKARDDCLHRDGDGDSVWREVEAAIRKEGLAQ